VIHKRGTTPSFNDRSSFAIRLILCWFSLSNLTSIPQHHSRFATWQTIFFCEKIKVRLSRTKFLNFLFISKQFSKMILNSLGVTKFCKNYFILFSFICLQNFIIFTFFTFRIIFGQTCYGTTVHPLGWRYKVEGAQTTTLNYCTYIWLCGWCRK
jgi:hypothetical protein